MKQNTNLKNHLDAKKVALASALFLPLIASANTLTVDYTTLTEAVNAALSGLITAITSIGGVVIAIAVGIAGVGVIKRIANKV